ncbi:MAG: hypothetical protein KH410_01565 [Weissella confusa]|nr:hypothetical protein [Weissella confusa]
MVKNNSKKQEIVNVKIINDIKTISKSESISPYQSPDISFESSIPLTVIISMLIGTLMYLTVRKLHIVNQNGTWKLIFFLIVLIGVLGILRLLIKNSLKYAPSKKPEKYAFWTYLGSFLFVTSLLFALIYFKQNHPIFIPLIIIEIWLYKKIRSHILSHLNKTNQNEREYINYQFDLLIIYILPLLLYFYIYRIMDWTETQYIVGLFIYTLFSSHRISITLIKIYDYVKNVNLKETHTLVANLLLFLPIIISFSALLVSIFKP